MDGCGASAWFWAWLLVGALVGLACTKPAEEGGSNEGSPSGSQPGSAQPGVGTGPAGSNPAAAGTSGGTAPGTAAMPGGSSTTPGEGTAGGGTAGESGASGASGGTDPGSAGASGGEAGSGPSPNTDPCSPGRELPESTTARGPWPVGQRTVKFGRFVAVEIMYQATPGSEAGKTPLQFDLRDWLPDSERPKVPDADTKYVSIDTYKDLPVDEASAPFPVVILVHGTGSFRIASGTSQALWASRGFVVVAADHPNLNMKDMLAAGCLQPVLPLDLNGDVDSEIRELTAPKGEIAFLDGRLDMTRLALTGHSAGAFNVAQFTAKPNVKVVILLSGTRAVVPSASLKSSLYVSGLADAVLPYPAGAPPLLGSVLYPGTAVDAYNLSPGPPSAKKRITGITGGGHLVVTDLCQTNDKGQNAIDVAVARGVCGLGLLPSLFDCGTANRESAIAIVNDVTTGVLEETLYCQDRAAYIAAVRSRHPLAGDFKEAK